MVIKRAHLVVQFVLELVRARVGGCLRRPKVGNLSEDVFKTDIVCHALGDTFDEISVRAWPGCKRMDDLPPNGDRKGQLGCIALLGQEGDDDIAQHFPDHARQLWGFMGWMDHCATEELEEPEAVEDAHNDRVWAKDDE